MKLFWADIFSYVPKIIEKNSPSLWEFYTQQTECHTLFVHISRSISDSLALDHHQAVKLMSPRFHGPTDRLLPKIPEAFIANFYIIIKLYGFRIILIMC